MNEDAIAQKQPAKVDLIVPVYNGEDSLEACLASIQNQTFKDFRVLLVDDGSADRTPEIAARFAKQDPRFESIRIPNGGASKARSTALERATAEYTAFIDSDDTISPFYLENMLRDLREAGADLVISSFEICDEKEKRTEKMTETLTVLNRKQAMEQTLSDWRYSLLWNKLFRSHMLQGIPFQGGYVIDDEFYTYQVIARANRIVLSPDVLYSYCVNEDSLMNNQTLSRKAGRYLDQLNFMKQRLAFLKKQFPDLYPAYQAKFADGLSLALSPDQLTLIEDQRVCQYYLHNWKQDLSLAMASSLPWKEKAVLTMRMHQWMKHVRKQNRKAAAERG